MATKRQRLAQATIGGEPTLSLPAFVSTAPETSGASAAGRAASLADCYLVYVYLCRTGAPAAQAQRSAAQAAARLFAERRPAVPLPPRLRPQDYGTTSRCASPAAALSTWPALRAR